MFAWQWIRQMPFVRSRKMIDTTRQTLPLFRDVYLLTQEILSHTVKFSRDFKFMLGTSLNNDSIELCTVLFTVNNKTDKQEALKLFLYYLERIKLQIRLCSDFHLFSYKQQIFFMEKLEVIKRQAIAWQKSEQKKINNPATSESGQDSELS